MMVARRLPTAFAAAAPLIVGKVLQLAGGFAVTVVLVWLYGLPAMGVYALASVGTSMTCLLGALGLANALSRAPLSNGARATASLVITIALYVPLSALSLLLGRLAGHGPVEALAIAACALGGCSLAQVNVLNALYVLQGRTWAAPLAPALHLVAIGFAATADDVMGFAIMLTAGRAVGSLLAFLPLSFGRVSFADMVRLAKAGTPFVPLDLLAQLGEQLPILVLSAFLGRAELGLLGLARQFLTMADTPGWSYVQAEYPRLVRDLRDSAAAVARSNQRLSWASGGLTAVTAIAMAMLVYRSPDLVPTLAIMLLPLPARYLNHFCDQTLRAAGRVADSAKLAMVKTILSLAANLGLVGLFGFWGAVAAAALLSGLSGLLYRWRVIALFPGLLPPIRPWSLA